MTNATGGPGTRRFDPVYGSAFAILCALYVLYLLVLLVTRGAGLPTWLVVVTLLPLLAGLAAYAVAIVVEFATLFRGRRGGSAPDENPPYVEPPAD